MSQPKESNNEHPVQESVVPDSGNKDPATEIVESSITGEVCEPKEEQELSPVADSDSELEIEPDPDNIMGNQTRRRMIRRYSSSSDEPQDNFSGLPRCSITQSTPGRDISPCETAVSSSHSDSATDSNESDFSFIGPFGKKQKIIRERLKSGESIGDQEGNFEQDSSPHSRRKEKSSSDDSNRKPLNSGSSSLSSTNYKQGVHLMDLRVQHLDQRKSLFGEPLNLSFSSDDNVPNFMVARTWSRGSHNEDQDVDADDGVHFPAQASSLTSRGKVHVVPRRMSENHSQTLQGRSNTPPAQHNHQQRSPTEHPPPIPHGSPSRPSVSASGPGQGYRSTAFVSVRRPGRPTNASYAQEAAAAAAASARSRELLGNGSLSPEEGSSMEMSASMSVGSNHSSPSNTGVGPKKKDYACHYCDKTFSQLRNYRYHLSRHEGTAIFACTCEVCGKTFNDKGYLSSHMKIHKNAKEYKCEYCDKSFNQRVAYNMHVRIHTGLKPHECHICKKAFSRKMLLRQHLRTHTGERPYQCSVCSKSFADRSNMLLHQRLHTGDRPYKCHVCGKTFSKNHHLKTHMNHHMGIRPYHCVKCGACFSQSSNMKTHMKKCNGTRKPTAPGPSSSVEAAAAAMSMANAHLAAAQQAGQGPSSSREANQNLKYVSYAGGMISSSSPEEEASVDYVLNPLASMFDSETGMSVLGLERRPLEQAEDFSGLSLHSNMIKSKLYSKMSGGDQQSHGQGTSTQGQGQVPAQSGSGLQRRSGPPASATVTSENAVSAENSHVGQLYSPSRRHSGNPGLPSRSSPMEISNRQYHQQPASSQSSSPIQARTTNAHHSLGESVAASRANVRKVDLAHYLTQANLSNQSSAGHSSHQQQHHRQNLYAAYQQAAGTSEVRRESPQQRGSASMPPILRLSSAPLPTSLSLSPSVQQQLQQQQQQKRGLSPSHYPLPPSSFPLLPPGQRDTSPPSQFIPIPLGSSGNATSPSRGLAIVPSPERASLVFVQSPHRPHRNLTTALINQQYVQQQHQQLSQQQVQQQQMLRLSEALPQQLSTFQLHPHQQALQNQNLLGQMELRNQRFQNTVEQLHPRIMAQIAQMESQDVAAEQEEQEGESYAHRLNYPSYK